jgi:hypothetical protein
VVVVALRRCRNETKRTSTFVDHVTVEANKVRRRRGVGRSNRIDALEARYPLPAWIFPYFCLIWAQSKSEKIREVFPTPNRDPDSERRRTEFCPFAPTRPTVAHGKSRPAYYRAGGRIPSEKLSEVSLPNTFST